MNFLLRNRTNIFTESQKYAKYKNTITIIPGVFRKPGNPLDNLDPGRMDRDKIDEYLQIIIINFTFLRKDRNVVPGSEAPLAYQATKVFPDWYRPYLLNYNGHGYLIVYFFFAWFCKN